jgi:hypothetical protein
MISLEGGCHCGSIRFTVSFAAREALDCNCSICTKKGFLHLIVPRADVTFLQDGDLDQLVDDGRLSEYRFATGVARHTFCSRCGIHPFYVPRSHPDGLDVNVRALDEVARRGLEGWKITLFDGRHWEESVDSIR